MGNVNDVLGFMKPGLVLYPRLTYLSLGRIASNGVEDRAIDRRRAERSPQGSVAETGDRSHCER